MNPGMDKSGGVGSLHECKSRIDLQSQTTFMTNSPESGCDGNCYCIYYTTLKVVDIIHLKLLFGKQKVFIFPENFGKLKQPNLFSIFPFFLENGKFSKTKRAPSLLLEFIHYTI
ncbi:hypothetical protein LXL04_033430 [Taraxacum kok-saghyz]